jgi:hypothetical protein
MSHPIYAPAVLISVRIYKRLLAAYPAAFRREFGPPMIQMFRDQCRDAWAVHRGWSLAALWCRILIDWIKTATKEHFENLRQSKSAYARVARLLPVVIAGAALCGGSAACLFPKKVFVSEVTIQLRWPDGAEDVQKIEAADPNFWVIQAVVIGRLCALGYF